VSGSDDLAALRRQLRSERDGPLRADAPGARARQTTPTRPATADQEGHRTSERAVAAFTESTRARGSARQQTLGSALAHELWIVLLWAALLCAAMFAVSLKLTFVPAGARVAPLVAAAGEYFWKPLAAGVAACLLMGLAFDLLRRARGLEPWSRNIPVWHLLLVLAAPAACIWSFAGDGYVSPESWSYIVASPAIGHASALIARYLLSTPPAAPQAVIGSLLAGATGILLAATAAPSPVLPSLPAQLALDRSLARAVPLKGCRHVPIESHTSLLRDSLIGDIACRQRGFSGFFMDFHNKALLDLYASQRQAKVRKAARRLVSNCRDGGGTYIGRWHNDSDPSQPIGVLLCYQAKSATTIETSDPRNGIYSIVKHRSRRGLNDWWRHHKLSAIPPV
jgi:hypothetical protein